MKGQIVKRISELSAWDLDAGCRNFINQASPANRRLKKKFVNKIEKGLTDI